MELSAGTSGNEFDVFLSFRGSDTRDNFTSCLYHDMIEKGIRVFKDDKELQVGEEIDKLLQALNDSQFYIPIFSQDFASSAWCLREVAQMVNCTKNSGGKKKILPLFFDVKPKDVKLETELYPAALSKHEQKYGADEVERWRHALRNVPTRVGWQRGEKEYGEFIKLIVQEVLLKLKGKNSRLPDHLVEMDDLKHIEKLLDIDSEDHVRFVIIHGIGGIGKSTLARVIFHRFHNKFKWSSFLEDVRSHSLLSMQKKLLSDTLGSSSTEGIHSRHDGIDRITRGFDKKKVLVVIDDVDNQEQLESLAGSCDWFGRGSRIIVTLRDLSIIIQDRGYQMQRSNYMEYSVKEMSLDQAIWLFSKHARSDSTSKDCYNFAKEVISSIGRLPLTLELIGSSFSCTARSKWRKKLEDLKQALPPDAQKIRVILRQSINKLDNIERAIFLDIACFCIDEDKTYADYMWGSIGYPSSTIDVLLLMSLVKIDMANRLWMHDELRDLGRYIVKEDSVKNAGNGTWVLIDENTLDILTSNEEKQDVQALSLGISHDLKHKELVHLPKLRFLKGERMNFVGDFKDLLLNLRWLSWHDCPPNLSAINLHPVNLVVLDLSSSSITHDWNGWGQIKMATKLKVLDLSACQQLTKTPNFSEFRQLEKLILCSSSLLTIDSSIGKLKKLSTLDIGGCFGLRKLPEEIGSLERLSEIIMPEMLGQFLPETFKLPEKNVKTEFRLIMKFGILNTRAIRIEEEPDPFEDPEDEWEFNLYGARRDECPVA